MSTRVKKIFAFLGRIVRYKVQAIATRIEVKDIQCKEFGPKTNVDHSKTEQGTKPKDDAANLTSLRKYELCYSWKDVARILDRVFFIIHSISVLLLSVILVELMQMQGDPPMYCNQTTSN